MRRPHLLTALLACMTLAVVGAGCTAPVAGPGEGEGEGEGGEGEGEGGEGEGEGGEGEGEGEARPTPTASIVAAPRFGVPADGVSTIALTVQLAGEDIAGRVVALTTTPVGPVELPATTSDASGVAVFDLSSTIDGTFSLELSVDGVVVDPEADAVVFTACRSLEATFIRDAWPLALSRCVGCHNEFGYAPASGARFVLPFPGDDDFAARGVAAVRQVMAQNSEDGLDVDVASLSDEQREALRVSEGDSVIPLILANPTLADVTGHSGGIVISPVEQEEIARFRSFIARLQGGDDTCGAGSENGIADEDLLSLTNALSLKETFKRAQLALTGQNASSTTLNTIVDEASLDSALDTLLANNRRVEDRLGEIWNDWLLTNAKVGDNASYLGNSFPRRTFYNPLQSEGARGVNSCNDTVASNCCRIPEDPLNLDDNPDNDVPLKPENVLCAQKALELRGSAGREPIEIMKRIWRDGLPAETMLTGDWTVVDPALAGAYGLVADNGRTFQDGVTQAFSASTADDANERRRVSIINTSTNDITRRNAGIDTWPHHGILTTPAFLNRYPNTASNRERTRARIIMENLLGIPVMKLAAFATPEIPAGQSLENLTWDTQPCVVCHTVIDPVASILNSFPNAAANLTVRQPCRQDGMRAPGFGFIALPGSGLEGEGLPRPALDDDTSCLTVAAACPGDTACETPFDGSGQGVSDTLGPDRLAWLADRVTEHPRFAYAVVVPLYEGLIGQKLISAPDSLVDPDFDAKARAFAAQQRELAELVSAFRAGGGRFQPVVKAIVLSRSFRADTAASVDDGTARTLELMGIGQKSKLMTPELLARRIQLLTGIEWNRVRNPNQPELLATGGQYNVFMGGIDSETVTLRSRDPVAIRAAVARRFGNEFSCVVVPQEFAIVPLTERRLFRNIDLGETPIAADGTIDAAVETRVLSQIRRLHTVLWNEETLDEDEVQASYDLFLAAIREMQAPADGSTTPAAIGATCQAVSKYVATDDGVRPQFPATGTVDITIGDTAVAHRRVTQDPTFTVRAWMAVLSTIIADPRFIFE